MQRLLVTLLLAATVSPAGAQSAAVSGVPSPRQSGETTQPSKRYPNGRSDSGAPFFRAVRLPISSDANYGKSQDSPIKTGPRRLNAHILFLNSLRGPNGEPVEYERKTSCCAFEDKTLELGGGLLDVYEVRIDGSDQVITLYINMYYGGPPEVPVGFTQRGAAQ